MLGAHLTRVENAPYDLRVADGTRVDVKTTREGLPLMIPVTQTYKLDPSRLDALLLVWDSHGLEIRGQISVRDFLARHREDGNFPVPTLHVEVCDLGPVPASWKPSDQGFTITGTHAAGR